MAEVFTTTTREGWGSRIKNSFAGIIFGLILLAGSCIGLWLNEGRSVKRYEDLQDGEKNVVSVGSDKIDAANDGKLVHFNGTATAGSTPRDKAFGVAAEGALKLQRKAEMYQWKESSSSKTKKNAGGSTDTTKSYSYEKTWSDSLIRSNDFKQSGHDNPSSMAFKSETQTGNPISVGAFKLSDSLTARLDDFTPLPLDSLEGLDDDSKGAKLNKGGIYIGADPASPVIGDTRINFSIVQSGEVSIVSQQSSQALTPYKAKYKTVELLQTGTHAAEEMFKKAEADNKFLTWMLRLAGFVVMAIGLNLLVKPISVIADVLPFVGNIVGAGVGIVMTLLAAVISFTIIAIAWVAYRPLLGISLLVIAGLLIFLIIKKTRGAPAEVAATADGPPPLN